MGSLLALFAAANGYKTYIGLAVGAATLIAHANGYALAGVSIDDGALMTNLWGLAMAAFGRSALAKVVTPDMVNVVVKHVANAAASQPKPAVTLVESND